MGPTTVALLRYFRADQAFIHARQRLDSATQSVRIQQGKVNTLTAEHDASARKALELEAKGRELDLEIKSRDERIELLRTRQQNATNPKEYQALLVEINTQKTDKAKIEEQSLSIMEQVEAQKKVTAELKTRVDAEAAKFAQMTAEIDTKVRALTAELEACRGPRDAIAKEVPASALTIYGRMADRFDGEAMAAIEKPDVREIDYLCTGCNTYLVANIYNKLMSPRDEIVTCPSCQRVLFVPDDMTPEMALSKKMPREKKAPGEKKPRAPRKKKDAAGTAPAPGSIAEAIAAGAKAAGGKGPKAEMPNPSAPLPSTADGRANVDTEDAAEAAAEDATETDEGTTGEPATSERGTNE